MTPAGEGAVGARPQQDLDIGLLHGVVVVDVDHRQLGAAFFPRARRGVITLTCVVHAVGTPDHDRGRRLRHLARVDAGDLAGAGGKAGARNGRADRRVEARIFLHIGEAVDAIAHHQTHGAGIVIGKTINITLNPDCPDILVDMRAFRQVILNIVGNAAKFTPQPRAPSPSPWIARHPACA